MSEIYRTTSRENHWRDLAQIFGILSVDVQDITKEFLLMTAKIWSVLYEIERSDSDKISLVTYYIPENLISKIWDLNI